MFSTHELATKLGGMLLNERDQTESLTGISNSSGVQWSKEHSTNWVCSIVAVCGMCTQRHMQSWGCGTQRQPDIQCRVGVETHRHINA